MNLHVVEEEVFAGRPLLTQGEVIRVEAEQLRIFARMLRGNTTEVTYMGEKLLVRPGVFPPRPDSIVLAQSFEVPLDARILDFGTGSGILGVIAGRRLGWDGATRRGHVVLSDISPDALRTADLNMRRRFPKLTDRNLSTVELLGEDIQWNRQFDVIIANPPFRQKHPDDFSSDPAMRLAQRTMWDMGFIAHTTLIREGRAWLRPKGTLYMTIANYPDVMNVMEMIESERWHFQVTGVREWYPSEAEDLSGIPLAVACLQLTLPVQE